MAEAAFDTHREFQRFRDAGFEPEKAEALVACLKAAARAAVATKAPVPFDAHRTFQIFRNVGFSRTQAEALAASIQTVLLGGVATRADLTAHTAGLSGVRTERATPKTGTTP